MDAARDVFHLSQDRLGWGVPEGVHFSCEIVDGVLAKVCWEMTLMWPSMVHAHGKEGHVLRVCGERNFRVPGLCSYTKQVVCGVAEEMATEARVVCKMMESGLNFAGIKK